MPWPRFWASRSSAKVESPRMLMRAMGSIWTATFSFIWGVRSASSGDAFLRAGVECRQEMAWQASWRNQHGVETHLEFCMLGMRHQPCLRRIDDALLLARRHGPGGIIQAGAGLDLDKGDQIALAHNKVDLAIGGAEALCQDAVTPRGEEQGGGRGACGGAAG